MTKTLIILGSSRGDGNTRKMVDYLSMAHSFDIIDLLDYNIGYYDYTSQNKEDDFLPLMRTIIAKYDTFIFATPVYWYCMSAIMKTFFDRISDLLRIEKDLGRLLRTKSIAMLSTSGHDDRNDGFVEPFQLSAGYLGMNYLGDVHTFVSEGEAIDEIMKSRSYKCIVRVYQKLLSKYT